MIAVAHPLSTNAVTPSSKATRSVWCCLPLEKLQLMLAVLNHLSIVHMFWCIFWDDLYHGLTRHRGKADWLLAPAVLINFFKKQVWYSIFSSHWGLCLTAMTFQIWWESGCIIENCHLNAYVKETSLSHHPGGTQAVTLTAPGLEQDFLWRLPPTVPV